MISILCPTRGRPMMVRRMMNSVRDTQAGEVEIILYFDNDDPARYGSYAQADVIMSGEGTVGQHWNKMADVAQGDILMMGNDDFLYQTPGWDKIVTEAVQAKFPDEIYVAWTDDGSGKAQDRCAVPIVSKKWVETLGYFCPPGFKFFYNDTWIWNLAQRLDRELYIPDVLVEHLHFSFGKMEADETTRRNRTDPQIHDHDSSLFRDTEAEREIDAARLMVKIQEWEQR